MHRTPLLPTATTLLLAATAASAQTPVLTVLTYDSFISDWGPGPLVEQNFEAQCGCDLKFESGGDGAALLSRLQLEGAGTEIDVVLGLDTNLTAAAHRTGLFAEHGVESPLALPVDWGDAAFLPFDWGYFAFVGNAGAPAPGSLMELAASDIKVVIQDPRSSTPGLGLLLWAEVALGDEAPAFWEAMSDNIVTVTPGWSEAYGLFLEGEADAVLSYTTSPAYHLIAEEDDSKVAWMFEDGHYLQVEVAGIVAATDAPDLAREFMEFMTSDGFQTVIPTTNWMYPAVTPGAGLPEGFDALPRPARALLLDPEAAERLKQEALPAWRDALSR